VAVCGDGLEAAEKAYRRGGAGLDRSMVQGSGKSLGSKK